MSATIPESMRLDDLLKATGYDCPQSLQGKTFDQATEGGAELEDNKTVSITENGVVEITPSEGKDGMKKVTATVNVSGGGSDTTYYAWGSLGKGYTVKESNLGLTAPTVDSVVNLLKTSTTQSYVIYLSTNAPAVGDSLPIYAYGKGTSIASNPLIVTAVNANEGSLTGTIDGDSVTLWCKSIVGPDTYLHNKYTLSYLPKIKGVEPITYSANGTYTIPSESSTWLNDYDGCGSASVTVAVPASEISNLNTSAEIPATVGTSQAMTVVNPPDTPVSLVYIQTFRDGQGGGSLSHSVSIADILANGSATLELEIGPGKLTCTVTAVADPHHITVTFEIASVASDYFGGSIRGVVV